MKILFTLWAYKYEHTHTPNNNSLHSVINTGTAIKTFTSEVYFYIPSILPFFDVVNPVDVELSRIQITSHCLAVNVRCEPNTRISVEIITPAYKVDAGSVSLWQRTPCPLRLHLCNIQMSAQQ